jgi:Telomere recombination
MTGTTSRWCAGTSPARPVRLRRQTGVPGHQGSDSRKLDLHPARDQGSAAQTAAPEEEDRRRAIPRHVVAQALLAELGEPLVSSTLLLPGQDEPLTDGWIAEQLDHAVDAVIDSGDCGTEPTTVIDFSQPEPEIVRRGAGDTSEFECTTMCIALPGPCRPDFRAGRP